MEMDSTDLIGWLFLKDNAVPVNALNVNGTIDVIFLDDAHSTARERHRVAGCDYSCDGHSMYKSPICSVQLAFSLGRTDVATAVVMVMSSFRAALRQEHVGRVKCTVGSLSKMHHGGTRLHVDKNDFSPYGTSYHDWTYTVYGDCNDDVPTNKPPAIDSVTGCFHLLNQTIAIRTLVVPICDKCYVTGNNQAVVKISAPPEIRAVITARTVIFIHSDGLIIPAGTLNKQWDNRQVWDDWQPLLSWSGCAMNTVANRHKDKDEIMDPAEVAKKNKIGKTAEQTADHMEEELEIINNGVKEKRGVGEIMKDGIVQEGFKQNDEVVSEKNLNKEKKKMSVHFVSKGWGVTDFQRDRVPVTDNVDSADVEPFLTKTDAACQTCGNTKGAPASRSAEDGSIGIPDVA
jgi:hypothetical protein